MKQTKISVRLLCAVIGLCFTLALIVFTGAVFDCYYEFNDDVLMKDILSGAYTGCPSALNVQMLSPVGAFISLFYRLIPSFPWYGLFLCACHYFCLWLMIYRAGLEAETLRNRILMGVIAVLFGIAVFLPHLVMIQYTVTVAVLASAAAFYFYTIPRELPPKENIKQLAVPAALVILAFWIRTEMLLLLMPFLAAVMTAKLSTDIKKISAYIMFALVIAVGMGASLLINTWSYSSSGWPEFLEEFDARTQLYDYQYIPSYEENTEFYTSIGLDGADVSLLENYDYGIDETIDGPVLGEVAAYAAGLRNETVSGRLRDAVKEYIYRVSHLKGGHYSVVVLIMYIMTFIVIFTDPKQKATGRLISIGTKLVSLFAMRSVSWIYIMYGRRQPDRITHSLYLIETVILAAICVKEMTGKTGRIKYLKLAYAVILIAGGLLFIPDTVTGLKSHVAGQEQINMPGGSIDEYCKAHPENFYYEDVYSTIIDGETFNEKMFKNVDNAYKNYDLLGGWIMNSPLHGAKLQTMGLTSAPEAVTDCDNVFIICSDDTGIGWLEYYYSEKQIPVSIQKVDTVAENFGVYNVKRHR